MKIEIKLPDNLDEEYYELRVMADRHVNASDLEGIYNVCRSCLKYNGNPEQVLEQIKEIAYRSYDRP